MAGVFVSYRREDSAGWSGRIYDRLRDHFGDQRVFMDVDNIPLGEDFTAVISRTLEQVDVVVVVIGPNWLRATDPTSAVASMAPIVNERCSDTLRVGSSRSRSPGRCGSASRPCKRTSNI